jgi:hypothetical protein
VFPYDTDLPVTESGFLESPTSIHPSVTAASARALSDIEARKAVLLGQSGLGKTHALRAEAERLNDLGRPAAYINLRGLNAQEARKEVVRHLNRPGRSTALMIDSLDEVEGTRDAMSRALGEVFNRYDGRIEQIRLAVTSGSQWTTTYECPTCSSSPDPCPNCASTGMNAILGAGHAKYEMAPLTEVQVRQAAATDLSDVDAFVASVVKAGIGPIAAYPLSLKLLLQAARRGRLPETRKEAYQIGAEGLAAGVNAEAATVNIPLGQRVAAARRLAVASVLSNAPEIWRRRLPGEDCALALEDVCTAGVTSTALDAVYGSGLMQGGTNQRGWTHRSIEEFLCAEGLRTLPRASVERLLLHPRATDTVNPRCAGVAAWLAALDDTWFDWLLERRYELLLNPDLVQRPPQQRRRLGAALVRHLQDGDPPYLLDPSWTSMRFFPDYTGLSYEGLGDDLAPLLADGQPTWRQRETLAVIVATQLRELDPTLMALIETSTAAAGIDDYNIQIQVAQWAAIALRGCCAQPVIDRAKVLLADSTLPWAVRAEITAWLWPVHLSADELNAMIPAADRSAGKDAFARRLGAILVTADPAPSEWDSALLRFIAESPPTLRAPLRTSNLTQRLCLRVLHDPLSSPADWAAAIDLTAAHLDDTQLLRWTATDLAQVPSQRRQRFTAEVCATTSRPRHAEHLIRLGLVQETDLLWWLTAAAEAYARSDETGYRSACQNVTQLAATPTDPTELDRFLRAAADTVAADQSLKDVAAACIDEQALRTRIAEAPPPTVAATSTPSTFERAKDWLATGRPRERRRPASRSKVEWASLERPQREELVVLARQHLLASDTTVATNVGLARVIAAHGILCELNRKELSAVPTTRWLSWLKVLVTTPEPAARDVARTALPICVKADPAATDAVLVELLHIPAALPFIRGNETKAVSQAALDIAAATPDLDPFHQAALLRCASAHLSEDAAKLALNMILQRHVAADEPQAAERALYAAVALASMPDLPRHFPLLLEELRSDLTFARHVVAKTGRRGHHHDAWKALWPDQLEQLFLWANNVFPEPPFPPPGVPISSNSANEFPDHILDLIGDPSQPDGKAIKDTARCQAAIAALKRLARHTGKVYLRQRAAMLKDASLNADSTATAAEVLAAIDSADLRIVTTVEQLVDAVLLALDDLADALKRDRALRTDLWHQQRPGGQWSRFWVPMEENQFSTWLSRQLKHYLRLKVALFREVEINPKLGTTSGDQPDIVVVALKTATQTIRAELLIEVKCNWNDSLLTALDDQLSQRYLQGPHSSTGIYLVAYYRGASWDPEDKRKTKAESNATSPRDLTTRLADQALKLTPSGAVAHVRVLDLVLDA